MGRLSTLVVTSAPRRAFQEMMVQKMVQKEDGTVTASHQLADAVVPFHLRHNGAWLRNLGLGLELGLGLGLV